MHPRYRLDDPSAILSPGLVIFRDLVAANIDRMIEIAGDPARLRPHCKTHKIREVAEMQLARGITKHKAATLARGLNADGGGAEMCLHATQHGGAVFATGSICWIASILVDDGVSQVTANVLRRFLR